MNFSKIRTYYPITVFLVLMLIFVLWATASLFSVINEDILENVASARMVHRATSEVILAELNHKPQLSDRLVNRLKRLIRDTNILFLALEYDNRNIVLGDKNELNRAPEMTIRSGHEFKYQRIYVWDRMMEPKSGKPFVLTIICRKVSRTGKVRDEGHQLLAIMLLGVGNVTFLILCASLFFRNRRLQRDVLTVNKRREQIEEMSLAATGLAHETKNPLGIIRGLAQQIAKESANSDEAREKANEIMEEADITTARLGDFMSYARLRKPALEQLNAKPHLTRVAGLIENDFKDAGVNFSIEIADIAIWADAEMLNQIVMNLLTNSLRSTTKGDTTSMTLKKVNRHYATLVIADSGSGIPEDFLPRIFKPYSTRRPGGYGIGMAIVKKIVEESGWTITVKSTVNKGTTVEINNIKYVKQG